MTDYWISGPKYWCEDCRKFISDNKASRKHHESGATHQESRRRRIAEMKNKQKEKVKEDNDMDREIQRLRREAHKQIYDDIANHVPIAATEYQMMKQDVAAANHNSSKNCFDYPKLPPLYKTNPPLVANPNTVQPVKWSYFDDEMIEAQRRRLLGKKYDKLKEEQEQLLTSLTAPPPPPKRSAIDKNINRHNSGIAGEYKVVDPNQYYNEYYTLAPEEQQGEGTDYDQYQQYYNYYQYYYYNNPEQYNADVAAYEAGTYDTSGGTYDYTSQTNSENQVPPTNESESTKSKRNDSDEDEEYQPKEIDITQEKQPEKTYSQLLSTEQQKHVITFKKPKNTNKKPRRK